MGSIPYFGNRPHPPRRNENGNPSNLERDLPPLVFAYELVCSGTKPLPPGNVPGKFMTSINLDAQLEFIPIRSFKPNLMRIFILLPFIGFSSWIMDHNFPNRCNKQVKIPLVYFMYFLGPKWVPTTNLTRAKWHCYPLNTVMS